MPRNRSDALLAVRRFEESHWDSRDDLVATRTQIDWSCERIAGEGMEVTG